MAEMAAVTVSMGVMKPLLGKLATLTGDEYKKFKGLQKEVSFLKRELTHMNAFLEKMDDADELDPLAETWRKDVIELSYDIEDYVDDFMDRVDQADDREGILRKASHFLRTFKDKRRLANKFEEIKALVIEAGERRRRYMLDQYALSTTPVKVDPRLSALYQTSENLVGIDNQKKKIVQWVMDDEQQLKVMSIVGFGGLGKTTLANEVYREVGDKFNCKLFVCISQNPDVMKLLNSLKSQLGLGTYYHACEPTDLINDIIKDLQDKRYIVVVDDLWDIRAWNIIRCAFLQNNQYSRVMITTRIEDVARAICGNQGFIHYMEPLSEKDSRKLFLDRICESEDECSLDFAEVSCKILKKCGGLPLAIITMASMIACQPTRSKGQWAEYIQSSLIAEFATNPTYEDMIQIIEFSYKNLPRHLKACFLYIGIYPEDHEISRVELVRRWVAEGIVSCSYGHDVWDVAESYFNELVNRSMIQPINRGYFSVTHCRVHDMMLELILRKCREDNFISLVESREVIWQGQDKVIRRISIDLKRGGAGGNILDMANTRNLSQVRSVNIFRGNYMIPNLASLKFMRLLFLNLEYLEMDIDLHCINHLSRLRYLKVISNHGKVHAQIRGLQVLETLDLSEYHGIPVLELVDLPRLSHASLSFVYGVGLPKQIWNMKSLVTLNNFSLSTSSLESITDLRKLTALSELTLNCIEMDSKGMMNVSTLISALISSLEKLSNLRVLLLLDNYIKVLYCGDAMLEPTFWPCFRKIEQFSPLLFIFSGVPRWIGNLCCLYKLDLNIKQIHQEDFNIIGSRLTCLISLFLRISHVPAERIMIGDSTGFKSLRSFFFDCDGMSCLTFEEGAMPELQELNFAVDPCRWDKCIPVGLQHLPNDIKRISVAPAEAINCATRTREEDMAIVTMMRDVIREASHALPVRLEVFEGWRPRPEDMSG